MTTITIHECDGCGERFGYKNTLREFPVVHEAANLYVEPETEVLLACADCIGDGPTERELYHTGSVEAWGVGRAGDLVTGVLVEHVELPAPGFTERPSHGDEAVATFEGSVELPVPKFTERADLSHEREAVAEFVEGVLL